MQKFFIINPWTSSTKKETNIIEIPQINTLLEKKYYIKEIKQIDGFKYICVVLEKMQGGTVY